MDKIITKINDVLYELDQNDFTATIIESSSARGNIIITRSINYDDAEFIITRVDQYSFKNNSLIRSIEFSEDSELISIGSEAFTDSSIESISFPKTLTYLGEGWCHNTNKLVNVTIHPDNQIFTIINDKMVVTKSDPENYNFDVLIFVPRDTMELEIPFFIKYIDSYAANRCEKLIQVNFEYNSELISIHKSAFSESSIESISLPASIESIHKFAFFQCKRLQRVEIPDDSNLISIGNFSFSETSIKFFPIPSNLQTIEGCCIDSNVEIIISPSNKSISFADEEHKIIAQKSDPNSDNFDVLVYVNSMVENVVIPSSIKRISSFVFSQCKNLQTVTILENTQLRFIDKYAFANSTLKTLQIPSKIEDLQEGWCLNAYNLSKVISSPKNENLSLLNENIILKKIDQKSIEFDLIAFAYRNIEKVIIPSFIKKIDSCAFSDCKKLRVVEFLDNSMLVSIGKNAFQHTSIEKITIPKNVIEIGEFSFRECDKLTTVEFESDSKLELIDKEAFSNTAIRFISIPATVKFIKEGCFSCCFHLFEVEFLGDSELSLIDKKVFTMTSIQQISIPDKVTQIDSYAFFCCEQLSTVYFSENSELRIIGQNAFSHSDLSSISIPAHVSEIKDSSFFSCLNLDTINFSEDSELKILGKESFCKTSINSIQIPKGVQIIGESCFSECLNLENIEFEEDSELEKICQEAFSGSSIEYFILPDKVRHIEGSTFHYCCQLQTIEIGENSDLRSIDGCAFYDSTLKDLTIPPKLELLKKDWCCGTTELMNVTVSPDNPYYKTINENMIVGNSKTEGDDFLYDVLVFAPRDITNAFIPASIKVIASFAFSGCQKLQTVEFEEGSELRTIESYAFSSSSIEQIKIPPSVRKICDSAFSDCERLNSIEISEDSELETICPYVFSDSPIERLTFPSCLTELREFWCGEISFLNQISISEKNENFCFLNDQRKIVLGKSDSTSEIFDVLIFACRDIEYAFIPSFIRKIDAFAFARCKKLKKIEFEENSEVQSIELAAFSELIIEKFVFPSSIKKIGRRSFLCCHSLKSIEFEFESKVDRIEGETFAYCFFESLTFPECINQIGFDAFSQCSNLKSVEFLGDVVSIEEHSFRVCPCLCVQSFPNASRVYINSNSFDQVSDDFTLFLNPFADLIIQNNLDNPLK